MRTDHSMKQPNRMNRILLRNKEKDIIEILYSGNKSEHFNATATRYIDKESIKYKGYDVTEYVERLKQIGYKIVTN